MGRKSIDTLRKEKPTNLSFRACLMSIKMAMIRDEWMDTPKASDSDIMTINKIWAYIQNLRSQIKRTDEL